MDEDSGMINVGVWVGVGVSLGLKSEDEYHSGASLAE